MNMSTDRAALKKRMGINEGGGGGSYKLNKVTMSGDDGSFIFTDLLQEREKGTKPNKENLGKTLKGVILKMRWGMSRYEEQADTATFHSSTEYDDKWKDSVTVYPAGDKGRVEAMKAKYGLSTQRIIYFFLSEKKEIVRLVVKSSAFKGDKNPNGEIGLFEYIDSFGDMELPCDYETVCVGVFREGTNKDGSPNKRKDHYAMSFAKDRKLSPVEIDDMEKLVSDVDSKTSPNSQTDEVADNEPEMEKQDRALDQAMKQYPEDDINPDDIPF